MTRPRLMIVAPALAALLVCAGCGDPPTEDLRGYTKAPLEDPDLLIDAGPTTLMDLISEPVDNPVLLPPDTVPGPAAVTNAAPPVADTDAEAAGDTTTAAATETAPPSAP